MPIPSLRELWESAIASMSVKHVDPTVRVDWMMLGSPDEPRLQIKVIGARDSRDQERRMDIHVHTMNLRMWPGLTIARTFLACAWATYFQHEALELCHVDDELVWDPHRAPYVYDQGFRGGMCVDVSPESIERTLSIVMGAENARRLLAWRS